MRDRRLLARVQRRAGFGEAGPNVNRAKGSLGAFDWTPDMNRCRFADRIVQVKLKDGMAVDRDEAKHWN